MVALGSSFQQLGGGGGSTTINNNAIPPVDAVDAADRIAKLAAGVPGLTVIQQDTNPNEVYFKGPTSDEQTAPSSGTSLHTTVQSLVDGASIPLDLSLGHIGTVTVAGNRTVAAATSQTDGAIVGVLVTTDGTARTLSFDPNYRDINGASKPPIFIPANTTVSLRFQSDGTNLYESEVSGIIRFRGDWLPSSTLFPGGASARRGDYYRAVDSGTIGGVSFQADDGLIALIDNASVTSYAGNWQKIDNSGPDAFQFTTGTVTGANGERWVINTGDTFQFPASPANGETVLTVPANSDWATLAATFATTDTATIDATVAVAGADAVTWVYEAAGDRWLKFLGGSSADFLYFVGELNNGLASAVPTLGFDTNANNLVTLDANLVIAVNNPPSSRTVILRLQQDAIGGRTVTFPASVLGSPPQPDPTALASTVYLFYFDVSGNFHY